MAERNLTGKSHHVFKHKGVAYLPASRLEQGLVPGLNLTEHFVLAEEMQGLFINRDQAVRMAQERIRSYNIKGTPATPVESLSGGNQQRALLALLRTPLNLILLEHPTRGLDIESTMYIWTKLKERCKQGTAIIFISADLDEILQYSDRILVFFAGKVSPPLEAASTSVEQLGQFIGGKALGKYHGAGPCVILGLNLFWRLGGVLVGPAGHHARPAFGKCAAFNGFRPYHQRRLWHLKKFSDVLVAWVPLLLTTAGLLITFAAGLWNIGIEGQIMLGAIFTTGALRMLQDTSAPPALILTLSILAGMLGGAIWAALAGALKTFGGVNEIFGGLGLNFVATALSIWLIFGPWKRPGVASMSGTERFAKELWLPMLPDSRLSLWAVGLAILVDRRRLFPAPGHLFWPAPQGGW